MSLRDRIEDDLKQALKAGDRARLGALRMVKSKIQEKQVELRGKQGADATLSDEAVQQVVAAYAKQRRDSIESYAQGGREDLAEKERAELAIVEAYLPAQLDDAELGRLVDEAVAESGASSMKDIGAVMKAVMPKVGGRADGKRVNAAVRARLQG